MFKKNIAGFICLFAGVLMIIIALLAPLLANEKPLFVIYKGHRLFPAFSIKKSVVIHSSSGSEKLSYNFINWKELQCEKIIFPPVAYSSSTMDFAHANYSAPGRQSVHERDSKMQASYPHWLGTDKLGRDVLAGIIHGARISLAVGLLSMMIAMFIGIFLGGCAGYIGDFSMSVSRSVLWVVIAGIPAAYFYAFEFRKLHFADSMQESSLYFMLQLLLSLLIFILILFVFYILGKLLSGIKYFNKQIYFPLDSIISRLIEIFISLPKLILIISIAAIASPSYLNLILIIGLTSWTEIARLTRAEFLKVRSLDYIEAAKGMGYSRRRIIYRHALPNALAPALVAGAFGVSSAILAESSLSFLGIGVPQNIVTWGSLLAQAKDNFSAWWLVIFPGSAIFITVAACNFMGESMRSFLDPHALRNWKEERPKQSPLTEKRLLRAFQ